jgi:hypothetical protein
MDRHNTLYKGSRVELPASLSWLADAMTWETAMPHDQTSKKRPSRSKLGEALGRIGVFTCGLAVVATASLLAFHVH